MSIIFRLRTCPDFQRNFILFQKHREKRDPICLCIFENILGFFKNAVFSHAEKGLSRRPDAPPETAAACIVGERLRRERAEIHPAPPRREIRLYARTAAPVHPENSGGSFDDGCSRSAERKPDKRTPAGKKQRFAASFRGRIPSFPAPAFFFRFCYSRPHEDTLRR